MITLAPRSRGDGYGRVDDIGAVWDPTELSSCSGLAVIENEYFAQRRSQETSQSGLAGAGSPSSRYHCRCHDKWVMMLEGTGGNCDDPSVVPFESNERSRFEDSGAHRPKARSAAFRSAAVSGPPDSASISFRNDSRSSSFARSSSALAT